MSQKIRTNEELMLISGHLLYEYRMFNDCIELIPNPKIQTNDALRSAIIESFAIHTRNLLKFFFDDKPREDDVVANDFFHVQNEWNHIREKFGDKELLNRIFDRVNKEVAHITYKRLEVTSEEKSWEEIRTITKDLFNNLFREFLSSVSDDNLGERFLELKKQFQNK